MEVMWFLSARKLSQLLSCTLSVSGSLVCPVKAVRELGVSTNNNLEVATHIQRTVSHCFAALYHLCYLCSYITNNYFRSLQMSLVHSRHDYGNFVLVGFPAYLRGHLNAAARLVFDYVVTTTSRTPLGTREFSVAGPTTWNSLPDHLQHPAVDSEQFRWDLKTYLFAGHL